METSLRTRALELGFVNKALQVEVQYGEGSQGHRDPGSNPSSTELYL